MKILHKSISTQTIGENLINVRKETLGQDDASQKVVGSNPVLAKDFFYLYNQLVAELGYFELYSLIILLIKHKLDTYQIKAFFKWCTFGPLTYF